MSLIKSSQIDQPVNFSGSFTGSLSGTASYAVFSETSNTSSLVTTSSFNSFTSSYYVDSASFDYRIENIIVDTGSFDNPPITVNVATTTVLPRSPLYNNGPTNNGVDAYLSASISGTLGNIDGVSVSIGDHILIKNQSNAIQNGVYNIISTGSASSYYILSRSLSSDETSELDSQIVIPSFGNTNKGGIFAQTTNNPIIGTDNIVYSQQTNTLITQTAAGTQLVYQIPWYLSTARQLSKGSSYFKYVNVTSGTTVTTSSLLLTGSLNVSGSINSVGGITGSLLGTSSYSLQSISSSYAATASLAPNYVLNSSTSSFITNNQTSSFVLNSQTSSMTVATASYVTASNVIGIIGSASYATTASYVLNAVSSSFSTTSSYALNAVSASYTPISRSFGLTINGAGSAITTGSKADVIIPYNMNISSWTLVSDQSGSIVIDVWKSNYNNFPPTSSNSIAGNQKPTIISNTKSQNTNLTNWTSSISAGDIIRFNVDSSSTITRVTLTINGIS